MDNFSELAIPALLMIFDPVTFGLVLGGVILGIFLGILPGIGGSQALALMFPFTFLMPLEGAVLFLLAIYSAAEYGGSIPSILIRTPGTAANAITVLDGYPMAKQGRAYRALMISLVSGVFGGIVSSVIFVFAASGLAWVGLRFGPAEMFAIGLFGLSVVGSFTGADPIKGFIAATIGLLLATVGESGFGGIRFDFGLPFLAEGIPEVVMIIALLAAPEAFRMLEQIRVMGPGKDGTEVIKLREDDGLPFRDWIKLSPSFMRGSLIGTATGVLPGPGPTISSVVAYNEEKRWCKDGDKFGTGIDEGIAAPEAANNACVAGALVPALALGIPGSGAIAVLMGVLISKGIVPGPTLFTSGGPLVLSIFFGLILCNILLLVIGIFGMRAFVPIAKVPAGTLGPYIIMLLAVGAYAYDNNIGHSIMVLGFGALAFVMEKLGFSPIPMILGFVMGGIIEVNLNRAMIFAGGDFFTVATRPITLCILLVALLSAVFAFKRGRSYE
ncbi:C4-dicarboxylate ABC transporter permease [Aureimonas fodinaquatilis]|uniref:C4-dicarboxylate ABC transporter permease n=1 Tax=Aureimonas fodinaquatilis TaxID=2565783 RepID=A0A5B0E5A8_9HYPH|nr:tripartite tricarboxylate transporter permease [Aureimonas fodinaquatilis]KAA0972619.1 C4-dicarboxylate ABC transporter permease [Aureimonas fodinaquatilis]